ncbi:uncharacterized protein UV8b_08285 [Ustilaginoidea virens]|uniref:Glucose-methanol-choline oxidoreductase N-terminal domain-containing protein n=1 Tax=Ustilaginoidea virens TaxID=1159556 RepID=A0A063BTB5_USTVR|nr:uncharacterized protein UV8b_08285 [Ustilaginoidea virens]QUC24044.1 hypothetical protein UV8b_08285 [Ustilaginoidea virens]GAO19191.1 hypothetical protein UVI_02063610 [Ustilaginoidea virens]
MRVAPLLALSSSVLAADWASESWDAIVVGAGTAGIIVADRLSEAGLKTLLLEQGGKSYGIVGGREGPAWLNGTDLSRVDVPGLFSSIFRGKSSLLCSPDQVSAFQACTVGGNSAINAGLHFQPPASDWDNYFPPGWHAADVQPSVAKLLRRQPPLTHYSPDGKFYIQSGYKAVHDWIVGSAGYKNVSLLDTINDKERVFGRPAYNFIDGQRGGPTRTYLQSALARCNFRLVIGASVKYVEQRNGVATGVTISHDGTIKTIKLARGGRVVLSAGAMLSPKILMYSGIGPREKLAKLAGQRFTPYVEPSSWVVQPQVGSGLFDNPNTFIVLSSPDVQSYVYKYDDPDPKDRDLYLNGRRGPYSLAGQTSVFWTYVNHTDGTRSGVQGTVSSSGFAEFTGANTITLNIYGTSGLLSSGSVELSDGNFVAKPSSGIYYGHPRDAQTIASFIHSLFQRLPPSTPNSPAKSGLTPLNLAQNSTLDEIVKYITTPSAYAVGSVQHWSSSCRIGKCVDKDTKVLGTSNIHVVDASILEPVTVNPQFAVMVAAEKGAERILASMRGRPRTRKARN